MEKAVESDEPCAGTCCYSRKCHYLHNHVGVDKPSAPKDCNVKWTYLTWVWMSCSVLTPEILPQMKPPVSNRKEAVAASIKYQARVYLRSPSHLAAIAALANFFRDMSGDFKAEIHTRQCANLLMQAFGVKEMLQIELNWKNPQNIW